MNLSDIFLKKMYCFTDELGRIFLEWYSCAMVHWWSDDEPGVAAYQFCVDAYQFGVDAYQFDVDAYQLHAGDDAKTDRDYNSRFEGQPHPETRFTLLMK